METKPANNFLRSIIAKELEEGTATEVVTRFPPEPNGYLHIGHASSICLNFGLAEYFQGRCNLRFDDTNPEKESQEYIDSIQADIRWLGYQWDGEVRFASSYFQQFYDWAIVLVKKGAAYVCDLNAEQAREYRGSLTQVGKDSPFRDRSVEENLDLLARMKAGEFDQGEKVLRAKLDMASPNMNMRDPILYRIRKVHHHQTGGDWQIYPTYDFAHGQEDALEGITHSICTLEFEGHRPLYNWFLEQLPVPSQPRQFEFGQLNLSYTIVSKRRLKQLVEEGVVSGWDDPRMPTLTGMRRRGYTARALRRFCDMAGVSRTEGVVDVAMLEHAIRDDLNEHAPRAMCVLNPLKVVITNYPEDQVEQLSVTNHPSREEMGTRIVPFSRELYIDAEDFREAANKKFKRLVIGKRVRLRNAYVIEAEDVIVDDAGNITEVRARLIENTLGNNPEDGVKPKGVIHWVSAAAGKRAQVRLFDRLFNDESPDRDGKNFMDHINPDSLKVVQSAWIEPSLVDAESEQVFQFEREGYFVADRVDHSNEHPVFNRTIALRDTWNH